MEGVGEVSSPHRGSCPLSARGEWLASWTPQPSSEEARKQHPGARGGGERKRLLCWGHPKPRCQQGPRPLSLASDTVWQKQCYSRKRGCLPLLTDNRGSLTFPPTAGPLPATDRPLFTALGSIQVCQSGSEQGAKKERRWRRHLAGSGSPSAEGWGCRT